MLMRALFPQIVFVYILIGFPVGVVKAESLDNIYFSEDMWDWQLRDLSEHKPIYVDENMTFSIQLPQANSSEKTASEIETLIKYQETLRTPETIELAEIEAKSFANVMKFGLGDEISPLVKEHVMKLLAAADYDMAYFLFREKKRFQRARPTQLSSELTAALEVPGHASYPSGHAMQARMFAKLFGYVDTARASSYLYQADQIALRREIMGLHYPSDTQAGKDMADEYFDAMLQVGYFRLGLDEAKRLYELEKN
jgi:acid phosphatase (class A)